MQDRNPFKLFVYADEESKLARCKSRAAENEKLSDKEILRKMKEIDRNSAGYHDLLTDTEWGDRKDYHLCINTSGKEIRALVPALTKYIKCWFGESEN